MKFFKIPFQSGGDEPIDPRQNKLQQYIQSQSVQDMTRLASEISPEVKQIIGTNVQALLGYLPNQEFNTTIKANKESLQNLLASAMITGYFMHAMEVRLSMDQAMKMDPGLESDLKDILQSPAELFEGLADLQNQASGLPDEDKLDSALSFSKSSDAPEKSDQKNPDKLNIQLEINTRMNRKELTQLLRELHKFQEGFDNETEETETAPSESEDPSNSSDENEKPED